MTDDCTIPFLLEDRDRLLEEIEKRDIKIAELERALALRDQLITIEGEKMATDVELAQIGYTCEGLGHILQAGISSESPAIRQEIANLMRLTADMLESQKFDINVPKRAKAFAETMRELGAGE